MEKEIKNLEKIVLEEIKKISNLDELKKLEVKYLGRKGELTNVLRGLKNLSKEEKPIIGKLANEVKTGIEKAFEKKLTELESTKIE